MVGLEVRLTPDCDFLFHVKGKPIGPMISELKRTCAALGIPYGRGKGIVFHDTRHSAVTNLVGSGVPEVVAIDLRRIYRRRSPGRAHSQIVRMGVD